MKILEKHIVDHIVENWDSFFSNMTFYRKEKQWKPRWRPDITGYVLKELPSPMHPGKTYTYKAPVFIEVKYNNNDRDVIYELKKALDTKERCDNPQYVMMISDNYSNPHIAKFLLENKIAVYKYEFTKRDFSDFKLYEYKSTLRTQFQGSNTQVENK